MPYKNKEDMAAYMRTYRGLQSDKVAFLKRRNIRLAEIDQTVDQRNCEACIDNLKSQGWAQDKAEEYCRQASMIAVDETAPLTSDGLGLKDWEPTPTERCIGLRMDVLDEDEKEATNECYRMLKNRDTRAIFEVGNSDQVAEALDKDDRACHPPPGLAPTDAEGWHARGRVLAIKHERERAREEQEIEEKANLQRDRAIALVIELEKKYGTSPIEKTRDDEYGKPIQPSTVGNMYGLNPEEYGKSDEEIRAMRKKKEGENKNE